MCFINDDYDWTVADQEQGELVSDGIKKQCSDCWKMIPAGETYRWTHAFEYEKCDHCGFRHNENCSPVEDGAPCIDEYYDFYSNVITKDQGEDYRFIQCLVCVKLREAIHEYEIKRGCDEFNAEPIEDLMEHYQGMGALDFHPYIEYASEKFPLLASQFERRFPLGGGND